MKKTTIISGPRASGKTWIASAISITHKKERVLNISAALLEQRIADDTFSRRNFIKNYDLIIIEECFTLEQIIALRGLLDGSSVYNEGSGMVEPDYALVFLTQKSIYIELSDDRYHVIKCNNQF